MVEVRPAAGEYVLFRTGSEYSPVTVELKRAAKITPSLVKFDGGYPRQCNILSVVASFASEEVARNVRDAIGGVAGEYDRRRRVANEQRSAAMTAAITAANKQIAAIVAKATALSDTPTVQS